MPLSDRQWKELQKDILDRRGLKWEWAKIDNEVKLEIRKAWEYIIDNSTVKITGVENLCVRCSKDVSHNGFYAMCDNAGTFCSDCWGNVRDLCLMVHGEGCATKVFQTETE